MSPELKEKTKIGIVDQVTSGAVMQNLMKNNPEFFTELVGYYQVHTQGGRELAKDERDYLLSKIAVHINQNYTFTEEASLEQFKEHSGMFLRAIKCSAAVLGKYESLPEHISGGPLKTTVRDWVAADVGNQDYKQYGDALIKFLVKNITNKQQSLAELSPRKKTVPEKVLLEKRPPRLTGKITFANFSSGGVAAGVMTVKLPKTTGGNLTFKLKGDYSKSSGISTQFKEQVAKQSKRKGYNLTTAQIEDIARRSAKQFNKKMREDSVG